MTAKLRPQDDGEPSPPTIRAYLTRLLDSPAFPASARRRRLLEYVVEQTLDDRANRLKAFDLAVAVLGRDERFDPQNDPIVRIEVGRLRRDLDHYYAEGRPRRPDPDHHPQGPLCPGVRGAGAGAQVKGCHAFRHRLLLATTAARGRGSRPGRRRPDRRCRDMGAVARWWPDATGRAGRDRPAVPVPERRRRRPTARERTDQRAGQQSDALRRAAGVRISDDQRQHDAPTEGGGGSAGLCCHRQRRPGPGPGPGERKADRSRVGSSAVEPELRSGTDRIQAPRHSG